MNILISNDDGISSPFLPYFIEAFVKHAQVEVVVPASEKSWIGRAYNRHGKIQLQKVMIANKMCHTLTGTPSDCVNIALAHIVKQKPDIVVSGLNLGQNVAMPLLWSSGTFAAAVEGIGHKIPSFAVSMQVDNAYYEVCRIKHCPPPEEFVPYIKQACEHTVKFVIQQYQENKLSTQEIININYPARYTNEVDFVECETAKVNLASLYEAQEDGTFKFKYQTGEYKTSNDKETDIELLEKAKASFSRIKIYE